MISFTSIPVVRRMVYDITKNPNWGFGRHYEKVAQQIVCKANGVRLHHERDDYKYDFMTSDSLKYEVKANKKSVQYRTFYIETSQSINNGKRWSPFKLSGLMTSEADYWMLLHGTMFLKITQQDLKRLIKNNKYKKSNCEPNPSNRTRGFIVPVIDVVRVGVIYNIKDFDLKGSSLL